jgi:hypothetical protein
MLPAADMHLRGGSESRSARFGMYALCSFPDSGFYNPSAAKGLAQLSAKAGIAGLISGGGR